MIVRPTVDTPDGKGWSCAPGSEPLLCRCGSDDILSIRPGGADQFADAGNMIVSRGVALKAWCARCFMEAHR